MSTDHFKMLRPNYSGKTYLAQDELEDVDVVIIDDVHQLSNAKTQ